MICPQFNQRICFSGDQESKTNEMKNTSGITPSKQQSIAHHQDISPSRLCDL